MTHALDQLYLTWLYELVRQSRSVQPGRNHWNLARALFTKEFDWHIPNDDNRVEDGKGLRYEFIEELELDDVDPDWLEVGCSMLELLIGLSRRLSFQAEGEPRDWFWHLIDNLGLRTYTDRALFPTTHVEEVLDSIIERTYEPDGRGGLFPLKRAQEDQRRVELWYQLNTYLLERT